MDVIITLMDFVKLGRKVAVAPLSATVHVRGRRSKKTDCTCGFNTELHIEVRMMKTGPSFHFADSAIHRIPSGRFPSTRQGIATHESCD